MLSTTRNRWIAVMWQVPAILLIAAVVAVAVNRLRPDNTLPLMATRPLAAAVQSEDQADQISITQARELFEQNAALFLDARSRDDYLQGHIRGALSLPWQEVDERFADISDELSEDSVIITYCDGERCLLSHHLARYLKDMGFSHVRVVKNGWSLWRQNSLPVEGVEASAEKPTIEN